MVAEYTITLAETGDSFPCRANQPVLEAVLRSRKSHLLQGCFGGGCGICKMRVTGEYEIFRPMSRAHITEQEEKQGIILTCCIYPRGELVLARGGE